MRHRYQGLSCTLVLIVFASKIANEYDSRFGKTVVQLEDELKRAKDFIGMKSGGRMLDYACGTGMLSRVRFPLNS